MCDKIGVDVRRNESDKYLNFPLPMYAWSGIPSRDNLDLHIKWSQRVSVVTEQSLDLFRRHLISYKLKQAGFYFAFE